MTTIDIKATLKKLDAQLVAAKKKLETLREQDKWDEARVQLREVEGLEETIELLSQPDAAELLESLEESQKDVAAGMVFTDNEMRSYLGLPLL